jgi:hypothetical protein
MLFTRRKKRLRESRKKLALGSLPRELLALPRQPKRAGTNMA